MIDDERLLLDIYRIKFENSGFEVYTCNSADDGVALLRSGYAPEVILLDITMPVKSGYQFLEDVKRGNLRGESLIVALTNEWQEGEKQRMAELGADAHLVKAHYVPSEIVAVVRELLEKKKR